MPPPPQPPTNTLLDVPVQVQVDQSIGPIFPIITITPTLSRCQEKHRSQAARGAGRLISSLPARRRARRRAAGHTAEGDQTAGRTWPGGTDRGRAVLGAGMDRLQGEPTAWWWPWKWGYAPGLCVMYHPPGPVTPVIKGYASSF